MYVHWSWRSIASECELPRDCSRSTFRRALDALARRPDHRVDGKPGRVDVDRTEGAHGIDDESLVVPRAHGGDFRKRIEDAGTGLAMHLRDMGDARIHLERAFEHGRRRLAVLREIDRRVLAAEVAKDLDDPLAVRAVVRHEHLAIARDEVCERGLHREGAATLQGDAHVRGGAVHDVEQVLADGCRHRVERLVPRSPVAQHRLLGRERGRQRAGGEEDGVVADDHDVLQDCVRLSSRVCKR
jgi:hypothetical protein